MLLKRVHISTLSIATISLFDLVTTLILLNRGFSEANPLFASLLGYGHWVFILAKLAFVTVPILMLEWARTKKPLLAEIGSWSAFFLYFIFYAWNFVRFYD